MIERLIRLVEGVGRQALLVAATLRSMRGHEEDFHAIEHLSAARRMVGAQDQESSCLADMVLTEMERQNERPRA